MTIILALIIIFSYNWSGLFKKSDNTIEKIAVITYRGEIINSINLNAVSKSEIIHFKGEYSHAVIVEPGKICFSESECADKTCIKIGWLKDAGDISACVPDSVMIEIKGGRKNLDTISY